MLIFNTLLHFKFIYNSFSVNDEFAVTLVTTLTYTELIYWYADRTKKLLMK